MSRPREYRLGLTPVTRKLQQKLIEKNGNSIKTKMIAYKLNKN